MKTKFIVAYLLLASMVLSQFSFWAFADGVENAADDVIVSESEPMAASEPVAVSDTITVGQMADFLSTKNEHYPLSDQFMERYQQTSGGYLDNAKKAGIPVDRQSHSPNQKWHFFDSWYYPSLEDGTLTRDEDAKSRIYTKLLCPELLLWIYEACGVDPAKVRAAMNAAEAGKAAGSAVATIAKDMRACVSWEDLAQAFEEKIPAESVSIDKTAIEIKAGESATIIATVSPSNATDGAKWTVTEGADIISITAKANQVTVKGLKEGVATIKIAYNESVFAECTVKVLKGEEVELPPATEGTYSYNITYELGTRVTAKALETPENVFATFSHLGQGAGIIQSVSDISNIYGGGHGGSGENKWYSGDMLKFGTTSVTGSITLNLSATVNYIKITGYVYDNACKLNVGGTEFICTDMNEVSKTVVEGGDVSTVTITFTETNTLIIETLNKKPLFITAIEIGYDSTLIN